MLRCLWLLLLISCYYMESEAYRIYDADYNGRIVNGVNTSVNLHPYQVSLQRRSSKRHICGGSIIHEYFIVTAAHCLENEKDGNVQVRLGSSFRDKNGILVNVAAFRLHEEYDDNNYKNDIALIKLAKPVTQSSRIRFIKLAKDSPKTGTPAIVTGWGRTCYLYCSFSSHLQKVEVSILDNEKCRSKDYGYGERILDGMICTYARRKDACEGDSGGPLVANNELVGIVSWGEGCANKLYPGVFTNVAQFNDWIKATIKKLNK